MRFRVEIWVPGFPKAQPRPRAFSRMVGGKIVARVYDAGTAEGWKSAIAVAARPYRPDVPLAGPLRVDATFLMPRPKSLMRKNDPCGPIRHTARPDRDNLDKAVLDALSQLGFWRDDAQACDGRIRKFYASKGGETGAWITIATIGEQQGDAVTEV